MNDKLIKGSLNQSHTAAIISAQRMDVKLGALKVDQTQEEKDQGNSENNKHLILLEAVREYEHSLESTLDILSLIEKNPVAHKWKVTYHVYALRETILWRIVDLSKQSLYLSESSMISGSRILVRAVLETLAALVYINEKIRFLTSEKLKFDAFSEIIGRIFIGTRIYQDGPRSKNAGEMIKCLEKRYPETILLYEQLCETAHPGYNGLRNGYSKTDQRNFVTCFGDFWSEIYGNEHEDILYKIFGILETEYNDIWIERFNSLEAWLVKNDTQLEASRSNATQKIAKN